MKLVTYRKLDGGVAVGELRNDQLYSLGISHLMIDLAVDSQPPDRDGSFKIMTEQVILAPLRPGKIIGIGRNYYEHVVELHADVQEALPKSPLIFSKYPTCVIGPGDSIQWRQTITNQVDWEGELTVVIGKTAREISEEDAYEHIFGYTIANDISARDLQSSEKQWTRAKSQDTFCPLGPAIVTKDEIPDPHNLQIVTKVNGETMQDGNTRDMIFKIPYLVSYLSHSFTLEPGDLILTGTPSGVGKGHNPPRYLKNGDEVSVTIEGIGTLTNICHIIDA